MFPAKFDYHRADSVANAVSLLAGNSDAKLLAGGHSLIPVMKLRLASPAALIDIGGISELIGVEAGSGSIRIGALTTHAQVASSDVVAEHCPMLASAASDIGDPAVRNLGTIGGNLAHSDPASDPPTVVTALSGTIHATGPNGARSIAASDFFEDLMTTTLAEDEIITSVELPAKQSGQVMGYAKLKHPASRFAVISAAAVLTVANGACTGASVAVGGITPAPFRASSVEAALQDGGLSDDALAEAASTVAGDIGDDVLDDVFASAGYRTAMAAVFVKRALIDAAASAG